MTHNPDPEHLPPCHDESLSRRDAWLASEEIAADGPPDPARFAMLRSLRVLIRQYREALEREDRLRSLLGRAARTITALARETVVADADVAALAAECRAASTGESGP